MKPALEPALPVLREATSDDLRQIQVIYAHHVAHGLGSFEETAPDLPEVERRWRTARTNGMPWLVAAAGDEICGYAYAAPYRARSAYRYTVEDSIYLGQRWQGRGLARQLLEALIERCRAAGYRQMIAIIGSSENEASIRLHAACGFRKVGTLEAVGRKHGKWVDSVLMQRAIADPDRPD